MPNYSYSEILEMQNDALRRVKEMQSRADAATASANAELNKQKAGASPKPPDRAKSSEARVPLSDDYMKDLRDFAKKAASSSHGEAHPKAPVVAPSAPQRETPNSPAALSGQIKSALSELAGDSDRVLILSLILLLLEERSDELLLLALLYML